MQLFVVTEIYDFGSSHPEVSVHGVFVCRGDVLDELERHGQAAQVVARLLRDRWPERDLVGLEVPVFNTDELPDPDEFTLAEEYIDAFLELAADADYDSRIDVHVIEAGPSPMPPTDA